MTAEDPHYQYHKPCVEEVAENYKREFLYTRKSPVGLYYDIIEETYRGGEKFRKTRYPSKYVIIKEKHVTIKEK